jgi:hypothetical protein
MNRKIIKYILAALLIAMISLIGACSSEEPTQPAKESAAPQPQETTQTQAVPAVEKKARIEETPIVEETPMAEPSAQEAMKEAVPETPEQTESAEPVQSFGTVQEPGMENAPPAPEAESQITETDGAVVHKGVQPPRGGAAQP